MDGWVGCCLGPDEGLFVPSGELGINASERIEEVLYIGAIYIMFSIKSKTALGAKEV